MVAESQSPAAGEARRRGERRMIARSMAAWIKVNGDGIYGTRPWRRACEGPTAPEGGKFKEADINWTSADYRFTAKGDAVYAFQMKWPEDGKALIRSFAPYSGPKVENVELLESVLSAEGYRLLRQVGTSGYRMDLAVEQPDAEGHFHLRLPEVIMGWLWLMK